MSKMEAMRLFVKTLDEEQVRQRWLFSDGFQQVGLHCRPKPMILYAYVCSHF